MCVYICVKLENRIKVENKYFKAAGNNFVSFVCFHMKGLYKIGFVVKKMVVELCQDESADAVSTVRSILGNGGLRRISAGTWILDPQIYNLFTLGER